MRTKKVRSTKGWRLAGYRWTKSGRRRARFQSPDGTVWEECPRRHAQLERVFPGSTLGPVYLRPIPTPSHVVPGGMFHEAHVPNRRVRRARASVPGLLPTH